MNWLKFILSHSIFIAFCAVALCYQTYTVLQIPPDNYFYGFVFFSTLSSYNFYWTISKYSFNRSMPVSAFLRKNLSHVTLFSFSGLGMLYFLSYLRGYLLYVAAAIILTLLYSLPLWPFKFVSFARKAGFLKPLLLAATWAFITVIVPASQTSFNITILVLFAARFLFMLLLCIIFDMRDISIDKIHSLHTLATDVTIETLRKIIFIVFGLYILCGVFVRAYFNETNQLYAFMITGLMVWAVYKASLTTKGYYFYYFLVDGLMILTAFATFIAAI